MCFKKSDRKLLTQMLTHPEYVQWYVDMQLKYPTDTKGLPTVMFRSKESIFDLIERSINEEFDLWTEPIHKGNDNYDPDYDDTDGCEESCEPFPLNEIEELVV